jgi:hypothetical protein
MKCGTNIDSESNFPLNKLYYDMQNNLNKFSQQEGL